MARIFEIEAGQVATELARRGVEPGRRVRVVIEPDDALFKAHCLSRMRFEAAGYADEDLPNLIKEARSEANAEPQ